jgi:serine/threonine protein kinase
MRKGLLDAVVVKLGSNRLTINGFDISIPHISFIEEMRPRGANGLVFRCTDTILRRPVAVKIWIPRQDDRRDRSRQGLAEASKIAQLNHRNIVQIHQCSQLQNGWVYSVMEYINGVNLDVFIKMHHSDFFQRYRLWKQLEEALNYSHELGVFHGDLHPGNVLVAGETIKVIDFGTSIFAGKKADSYKRETRLLIALNRKIFLRYEPGLREIIDVDLRVLNPIQALHALSAWVDILFRWRETFAIKRREDWLLTAMIHLAFDVMRVPLFSIPCLVQRLAHKKASVKIQNHFVAQCLIWANVFLEKTLIKGSHPPYYSHNADSDAKVNEARIEELMPSLRETFYRSGPFQ